LRDQHLLVLAVPDKRSASGNAPAIRYHARLMT